MKTLNWVKAVVLASALAVMSSAQAQPVNKVVGAWKMVSAQIDRGGSRTPAYGPQPNGMLVFTEDMRFIEVLTDATLPRFASDVRGEGTVEENRAAMAVNIAFFGTYTVDEKGDLSGNRVEGSTFPNWVGSVRTQEQLRIVVEGDRMMEYFRRPEGSSIVIEWQRLGRAG